MSKPVLLLSKRRYKILGYLFLIVLMMFVAIGQIPINATMGKDVRPLFTLVQILLLTSTYFVGFILNIYIFVPRLLFKNKYLFYSGIIIGMTAFQLILSYLLEWIMLSIYNLSPSSFSIYSGNYIVVFFFLSTFSGFFISIIGSSFFVFLRHWWISGKRIDELEKTGISVELEKTRNKIDTGALFDVLDKAASIAISVPKEASNILLELSRSLRRQLYESEQKPLISYNTEKTFHPFREQNNLLNFLVDNRFRIVRNILLFFVVILLGLRT